MISFLLYLHTDCLWRNLKKKNINLGLNDISDIMILAFRPKSSRPSLFLPHPELKRPGNEKEVYERRIIHDVLTGSNMAAVCRAFRLLGITSTNPSKSGR